MPEERQAPQLPSVSLEAEPLKLGLEALGDAYALQVVKETFWAYEQYRSQNHDPRWNSHESLYLGWLPPRMWEGTQTPRSHLGMPVSFSQVESAFPAIYQALFLEDEWFKVNPEPGSDPQEAKAIQAHLRYSLVHPRADYTGNAEIEFELAIKQQLLHGNGGIGIEWDSEAGHPRIEWVDIRDFYIDPGCPVPSVDAARSIIRRKLCTIDELDALRSDPRMKIPSKEVLVNMARNSQYVYADKTKQVSEALRGNNYNPSQHEWSPVPAERKIECLVYYSKHRIIWVLNREWVVYSEKNPYGFIPFCFAPCIPFPGRFYGISYPDIIENPQRYIEALYNGRLDGLALALRPPRVRKRGSVLTASQQRWSPGSVQEADDPSKDVAVLAVQGDTSGIMGDVAYLEGMVRELTGNGTGVSQPKPGNANRTATGMNIQAGATSARIWPLVKHVEDYMIVPMLYKMYKMVQVHTYPGQLLPALGKDNEHMQVGAESFNKPVRFTMLASSKMLTREKLAQVVPFLAQFMLNGPFVQGIQASGQTVDFDVFGDMIQAATGTSSAYRLIRPMNEQEIKAKQTPPPQVVMEQQKAQADHQVRLQMGQMKAQSEIQKEMIKKQPVPADPQEKQAEMEMMMAKIQAEREKAQIQRQTAEQKMVMDAMMGQQKLRQKEQESKQKMFMDAAMSQQQMQTEQQRTQNELMLQHAQGQQQLRQGEESGAQKLTQSKQLGDHKMKMDAAKMKLQARLAQKRPALKDKKA